MPLFGPFARLGDAIPPRRYRFGPPQAGGDFYGDGDGYGFRDSLGRLIRNPKLPPWPGGPPNLWGDAGPPVSDAPPIRLPDAALAGPLPLFPPLGPQTTRRTQLFGPLAML